MECTVTSSTTCEAVLDVRAEVRGSDATLGFKIPKRILEWTAGQRFFCVVNETVDDARQKYGDPAVTLRGELVRRDGASALVSHGGLLMSLPAHAVRDMDTDVVVHLVPVAPAKKRALRPRRGDA